VTALFVFDCYETILVRRSGPRLPSLTVLDSALAAVGVHASTTVATEVLDRLASIALEPLARQPPTIEVFLGACARAREVADREVLAAAAARAFSFERDAVSPVPDIEEVLREIRAAGHAARVLSNCLAPGMVMDQLLDDIGLGGLLDQRAWSSEIGLRKPHPGAFASVADGTFDRVVMVGDSEEIDLAPARSLGWIVVRANGAGDHVPALRTLLSTFSE
jgi:FMN phosphatase YigB (HAD superfamily)